MSDILFGVILTDYYVLKTGLHNYFKHKYFSTNYAEFKVFYKNIDYKSPNYLVDIKKSIKNRQLLIGTYIIYKIHNYLLNT